MGQDEEDKVDDDLDWWERLRQGLRIWVRMSRGRVLVP